MGSRLRTKRQIRVHSISTDAKPQLLTLAGLSVAQVLAAMGQMLLATVAGIVGARLAPAPELATLPVAAAIVGVALCSLPASLLIRQFGRKTVFIGGLLLASVGALLAAWSITLNSFVLFSAGCFLLGTNMAVVAQYRFAAADSVPVPMISQAVSALMLATLVAAMLMPWVAVRFRDLFDIEFSGSFFVAPVLFIVAAIILALLPLPPPPADNREHAPFDMRATMRRRDVQLAIIVATGGFGVMSLVMTAAPVSMHVIDGHSVEQTADAIRWHIIAMYAPSLFSGWMVARLGLSRMVWAGIVFEALSIGAAMYGQESLHYRSSLILLGIGWNLLYVSGTTLLATAVRGNGSTRMQGANDMIMFGTTAVCSVSAGALLYTLGWFGMNLLSTLLLVVIVVAIWRARGTSPALSQA